MKVNRNEKVAFIAQMNSESYAEFGQQSVNIAERERNTSRSTVWQCVGRQRRTFAYHRPLQRGLRAAEC